MEKFIISGGVPLKGKVKVSGAKNVAMKAVLAGLLTKEPLVIDNIPLISSVLGTAKIVKPLGVKVKQSDHTLNICANKINKFQIPLEMGGLYRTVTMVIGPMLARFGKVVVPNPGGCRLGKRPVDWHIKALSKMGAQIKYQDGYFYAQVEKLQGTHINFPKNSHTGTETIILAAVLAKGETVITNAAQEPEVDDLISLLKQMGAKIKRKERTIFIKGVKKLSGTRYKIMPDRNEVVTFAVAAIATKGDVIVQGTQRNQIQAFLSALDEVGGGWEAKGSEATRFYWKKKLKCTDVVTQPHPGFMTDWQAPWAVLMTQAEGESTIHETIFEQRFSYVLQLRKMGAKIDFFDPPIKNPRSYYNFNWNDRVVGYHQGIKINGPSALHEAVVEIADLRAGATLVVAALVAKGESALMGIKHIDRGYEKFDKQLLKLGAKISRIKEDI